MRWGEEGPSDQGDRLPYFESLPSTTFDNSVSTPSVYCPSPISVPLGINYTSLHKTLSRHLNSFVDTTSDCLSSFPFLTSFSALAWAENIPDFGNSLSAFVKPVSFPRKERTGSCPPNKLVERDWLLSLSHFHLLFETQWG